MALEVFVTFHKQLSFVYKSDKVADGGTFTLFVANSGLF